jgi:hypothetical protein
VREVPRWQGERAVPQKQVELEPRAWVVQAEAQEQMVEAAQAEGQEQMVEAAQAEEREQMAWAPRVWGLVQMA